MSLLIVLLLLQAAVTSVIGEFQFPVPVATACGPRTTYESPRCVLLSRHLGYELREYPANQQLVETIVDNASYDVASSVGFYRCEGYISGDNAQSITIPLALPVTIQPLKEVNGYAVAFYIPSSIPNAPTPRSKNMRIIQTIRSVHAVIGPFGGGNETSYYFNSRILLAALDRDGVKYDDSTITYVGYSSPSDTVNRQQEVHVKVILE